MSAARSLAVEAVRLTKSRAASGTSMFWMFLSASVTGAKASLTVFSTELVSLVSVVIGVLHPQGLSYVTPSALARGRSVVPSLMVRRNINVAVRYHEFVIKWLSKGGSPLLCMGLFSIFLFWPCPGPLRRQIQLLWVTTPVGVAKPSRVRIRFSSHQPNSGDQSSKRALMPSSWAQCCAMLGLNC